MIRNDAANGFDIPVPLHPKTGKPAFVEVSMPSAVMRADQQARQAHSNAPNAANLPPMRIVERGTLEHLNAVLQGGVVFIKEDPLNPTIVPEDNPFKGILQGKLNSQQS